MNWLPIIGALMLIIGLFQLSMTVKTFKVLKVEANHDTSVFMPMALSSSALMGIVFFATGIGALLI